MKPIEVVLMALLDDLAYTDTVADWRVITEQLAAGNGFLRIARVGGNADRDTDNPTVSIQCFAQRSMSSPLAVYDLENAVWQRFLDILNGVHDGWAVGEVIEDPSKTGPVPLPSPDPSIAVVESTIRLTRRT